MRHSFSALLLAGALLLTTLAAPLQPAAWADTDTELTIWDPTGAATAYIALDDDLTIYLWDGEPVAYLHNDLDGDGTLSIYAMSGRHLGWLEQGIVRDHAGYAVGFLTGATTVATQFEPFKAFRQFKPFPGLRELEPLRPLDIQIWSAMPLQIFLASRS